VWGNSYLEELPPASATYTASNRVATSSLSRLIVPASRSSPLLINPLAEDAGGSLAWRRQHWQSQSVGGRSRRTTVTRPRALDYETFKTRDSPPPARATRGTACHSRGRASYLEELPPGSKTYTRQSRRNFARAPRRPASRSEPLLINPWLRRRAKSLGTAVEHWQSV
jgi:hypothetical protein